MEWFVLSQGSKTYCGLWLWSIQNIILTIFGQGNICSWGGVQNTNVQNTNTPYQNTNGPYQNTNCDKCLPEIIPGGVIMCFLIQNNHSNKNCFWTRFCSLILCQNPSESAFQASFTNMLGWVKSKWESVNIPSWGDISQILRWFKSRCDLGGVWPYKSFKLNRHQIFWCTSQQILQAFQAVWPH